MKKMFLRLRFLKINLIGMFIIGLFFLMLNILLIIYENNTKFSKYNEDRIDRYKPYKPKKRININTYKEPANCFNCPGENGQSVNLTVMNMYF